MCQPHQPPGAAGAGRSQPLPRQPAPAPHLWLGINWNRCSGSLGAPSLGKFLSRVGAQGELAVLAAGRAGVEEGPLLAPFKVMRSTRFRAPLILNSARSPCGLAGCTSRSVARTRLLSLGIQAPPGAILGQIETVIRRSQSRSIETISGVFPRCSSELLVARSVKKCYEISWHLHLFRGSQFQILQPAAMKLWWPSR
jgi:hypothetical protein